jgi:hypothetical protein
MTPSSLLKQHAGSGREPRRKKAPSAACVNEIGIGEARSGPQDETLVEARSRGGNPWNLPKVAAQGAFQGYEKQAGGLMAAWGKDFIGEATVNVLQQVATNATNGFIDANSLEIEDGQVVGWRFDGDQWAESVFGKNALASYVGSFARAGANELLKGTAVGLLGEGANNYTSLIKTASALAGEGVGSLIDGEFSLNLLNLTDILNPFIEDKELLAKMDMGLFSMNFSKDENGNIKNTSRINSAGANVGGLVGLYQSALGMKEAYNNVRIGLSGADEKTTIALRGISSNGQEKSADLFEEILSGKTTLQEAFSQAVGEMAKTTATEYGKEIGINFEDLNGFELGVVLAHEAMRNGRKDGEEGQRQETLDAVLAHSDHAMQVLEKYGLGALGYQMVQEAIDYAKMQNGEISQEDFEVYVDGTYDSSEDFWKLTRDKDGRLHLAKDGDSKITFIDEVFNEVFTLREFEGLDEFESLAYILGLFDNDAYRDGKKVIIEKSYEEFNKRLRDNLGENFSFDPNNKEETLILSEILTEVKSWMLEKEIKLYRNSSDMTTLEQTYFETFENESFSLDITLEANENLKAGIAIHDFLRLTRSVPHQVGNQVWESMEYTGEESGWYMNLGIVGKYISNMGPHYTVAKEGVKPYDTEWYTNNGFISPKIFMYSPESLDSQPTIPAHPLLPKHESSYIPELPIISYQETVTSRQSKIKDTPLYFGKYRTIEHSNVNVQVGSGYASAYQAGFEAALKLGAGSIISFNNGTDLIVWEINGIKLTTMWSQNDDFQKGPVFSYQQDFTGRYTSMYEVYNMPEGIEKGWRNFLGGLVGY